jgi:hypothetical protein
VKKLVVFGAGVLAAGSVALFSAGAAVSDPVDTSAYNVVGEPYGKAVAILKNMGVKATFGGSRGSALPQAECLVDQQKVNSSGKMLLMLDCTAKAAEAAEAAQEAAVPGPPTVGSNGVTTVTPTPVGPQPGMQMPVG